MQVHGDYHERGYAHLEGLIPAEVARAFLHRLKSDLAQGGVSMQNFAQTSPLTKRTTYEIYGHIYPPMITFLWALTPTMRTLTGRDLLPTYDYFRIYRQGDICRLHSDRPSCEHSLSLTLGYSDGKAWPFEIGAERVEGLDYLRDEFGGAEHASIAMQPGDAILYQGVGYKHGRITPNPNRWSAHLFLHWVDRDGPYADQAFDRNTDVLEPVDFALG